MQRDGRDVSNIASLKMLSKVRPGAALALLVLMFSLAGVPPTLGFFAKYGVVTAAIQADLFWLAVLGMIASVPAAFYYLRIVYFMYFGENEEPFAVDIPVVQMIALAGSAVLMLALLPELLGLEPLAAMAADALVN